MQILVPKIMNQNLAVILRQFNYSKNWFIVLVLVVWINLNWTFGLLLLDAESGHSTTWRRQAAGDLRTLFQSFQKRHQPSTS